jgi:hypothetical protein
MGKRTLDPGQQDILEDLEKLTALARDGRIDSLVVCATIITRTNPVSLKNHLFNSTNDFTREKVLGDLRDLIDHIENRAVPVANAN